MLQCKAEVHGFATPANLMHLTLIYSVSGSSYPVYLVTSYVTSCVA